MKHPRIVAKPSVAFGVIEAAHASSRDLQTWVDGLLDAAKSLIVTPLLSVGLTRRQTSHYEVFGAAATVPEIGPYFDRLAHTVSAPHLDAFWRFPAYVASSTAIVGEAPEPVHLREFLSMVGARDALGLIAMVDEYSLCAGAPSDQLIKLSAAERQLLTLVVLHLEAGLRLRARPATELAVLRPDGKLMHAEGAVSESTATRAHLTQHVKRVERGRGRRARQQAESVDAWSALVSGRWGLVAREEPSVGRHYAILETTRDRHLRALSDLETHVVELSARGLTGKGVAYALGLAPSTVSKLLASAALKLGLRNRTDLVQLTSRLLGVGSSPEPVSLTKSERDVLGLVRLGWTNARIAKLRGRAESTVANQVASLLEKLKVPSRRALATVDER